MLGVTLSMQSHCTEYTSVSKLFGDVIHHFFRIRFDWYFNVASYYDEAAFLHIMRYLPFHSHNFPFQRAIVISVAFKDK